MNAVRPKYALPWRVRALSTEVVADSLRLRPATIREWHAKTFGSRPKPYSACWTPAKVRRLRRLIEKNRAMVPTWRVARLLGVNRTTIESIWGREFKLPPIRKGLIGVRALNHCRAWSARDIARLEKFVREKYRNKDLNSALGSPFVPNKVGRKPGPAFFLRLAATSGAHGVR
jgi:hypothetical protein